MDCGAPHRYSSYCSESRSIFRMDRYVQNICWSYWESSSSPKPEIISFCERSWKSNGGFDDIKLLTPLTLPDYLGERDLPSHFEHMPPVKKANAIRLALLSKYGGYWLDAGVAVSSGVEDWVSEKLSEEGFFAFQGVGKDRLLATWFLASTRKNPFVAEWSRLYNEFFSRRRIHEVHSQTKSPSSLATHVLARLNGTWLRSSPTRTALWAKPPLRWLPFYPYFIMHYLANKILEEPRFGRDFASVRFEPAGAPLRLRQVFSLERSPSREAIEAAVSAIPIHKLNTYRHYDEKTLRVLYEAFSLDERSYL